jgi:hypothetical protein
MSDSTSFLDAGGIRRDQPILPKRHPVDAGGLEFLGILANLGEPGSIERQGWDILLQVHGFQAVVQATARCFNQVDHSGKVRNEQAQAVLDGKLPVGHDVIRHSQAKRRSQVA